MKQYIKTLALCLMAGLGLASCNDNFDEDEGFVTYPQHVALGTWECEYVNSTTPYSDFTVSLTLNEEGDTICNLTFYEKEYGTWYIFSNGEVTYNPAVGMTQVFFDASSQGIPAELNMALQRDLKTMGVQFIMNGNTAGKLSFRAEPATSFNVVGQWTGTDAAGNTLGLNFDNEEGTCAVTINYADEAQTDVNASGTYSFTDGTGAVAYTTAEGQAASIALGLNDKNQLTATTANGTTYVMAR